MGYTVVLSMQTMNATPAGKVALLWKPDRSPCTADSPCRNHTVSLIGFDHSVWRSKPFFVGLYCRHVPAQEVDGLSAPGGAVPGGFMAAGDRGRPAEVKYRGGGRKYKKQRHKGDAQMDRDREIIRRLVEMCLSFELDVQAAHAVLSAIGQVHPEIRIQEVLNETRSKLEPVLRERYRKMLDQLDTEDSMTLLEKLPKACYSN
jgi:hypothetical protein